MAVHVAFCFWPFLHICDAAGWSFCENNIKQVGLAERNYLLTLRHLDELISMGETNV
jgi:Zn-dependent protease